MSHEYRAAVRRVWVVMGVVVVAQALALFGVSRAIIMERDRVAVNIDRIEAVQQGGIQQTILGCQRGNELRRAVGLIGQEQAARTGATSGQRPDLDPQAFTVTDCRATVVIVHGVDPGPVPPYVP